jgi:hypothetical protein
LLLPSSYKVAGSLVSRYVLKYRAVYLLPRAARGVVGRVSVPGGHGLACQRVEGGQLLGGERDGERAHVLLHPLDPLGARIGTMGTPSRLAWAYTQACATCAGATPFAWAADRTAPLSPGSPGRLAAEAGVAACQSESPGALTSMVQVRKPRA